MPTPDILAFQQFYRMKLGKLVRRVLAQHIAETWPDMIRGKRYGDHSLILGLGYALPYLKPFLAARLLVEKENDVPRSQPPIACMPAASGVIPWPRIPKNGNKSLLVDEYNLPFADHSAERVIISHMLEFTDSPDSLLDEVHRVLSPSGKIIIIVPNRVSAWASRDVTPFGYGTPFTVGQLESLVEDADFHVIQTRKMLQFLPIHARLYTSFVVFMQKLLKPIAKFMPACMMGGVLVLEAEKRSFAMIPAFKRDPARAKKANAARVTERASDRSS